MKSLKPFLFTTISILLFPTQVAAGWKYDSFKMGIDEEIAKTAEIKSLNSLSLNFPYQGKTFGNLVLRTHPRSGLNIMIILDRGQILCGINSCEMRVKFDQEASYLEEFSRPNSLDSDTLFLDEPEKFEEKILKSKLLKIELKLFKSAPKILEFDVSSLNPEKIGRPSLRARQEIEDQKEREFKQWKKDSEKIAEERAAKLSKYSKIVADKIATYKKLAATEGFIGNFITEYNIEILPNGYIKRLSLQKSSGNNLFDEGVERAIRLSAPFDELPSEILDSPPLKITISQNIENSLGTPDQKVSQPIPRKENKQPTYSAMAERLNEKGEVKILFFVRKNGEPTNIKILQTSGFPRLDYAALDAAKTWRFEPATLNGQPVDSYYLADVYLGPSKK